VSLSAIIILSSAVMPTISSRASIELTTLTPAEGVFKDACACFLGEGCLLLSSVIFP